MGRETAPCERKFVKVVVDAVEVDGTFHGYASLFGRVDLGHDVVERGAFANSLKARGTAGIRMLYQHDPGQPIGTWTQIREDRHGLFVRGRINGEVARGREVLSLLRSGAIDGLSIGFRAVKARRDERSGVRRILEADLWEISIVTFPMLPGARVEAVKGRRARPVETLAQTIRAATRLFNERPPDHDQASTSRRAGDQVGRADRRLRRVHDHLRGVPRGQ